MQSKCPADQEAIEVIDLFVDFTVPPHQIARVWRHQSLSITARLGEDREPPGACMAHYPTDHRRGVSAGTAGAGGTSERGKDVQKSQGDEYLGALTWVP